MAQTSSHVQLDESVEYWLFPNISEGEDELEKLEAFRTRCFTFIHDQSRNYIWHEDSINLNIIPNRTAAGDSPPHLYGKTRFGCNVEDEWFIVHLLRSFSVTENDVVIRIVDSDGEFLLVEAADSLPRWANPETCINRVFIHGGQVHIISIADRPSSITPLPSGQPSLMDAVHIVRSMPHLTIAPAPIQEPIHQRIDKCVSQIDSSLHRCNVFVPAGVAALLQSYPTLVAPAIHAFCQRDASQLQVIRAMRFFPPETRVWTSVTFTKCLYAMLVHRNYQPDHRTGWSLPPIGDSKRTGSDLGMKLAIGFELLANEESLHQKDDDYSLDMDSRWNRFLNTLKEKGFFQDFLDGSKPHNELMEKAREFYINSVGVEGPAKKPVILRLMQSVCADVDKFKKVESHLPADDDDSWLSVDPATLDQILGDKFGLLGVDDDEAKADILPKLETFLNRTSDYEGLTPANGRKKSRKLSHLAPPSRKTSTLSNASDASQLSTNIGFDPDSFASAMQGILDFALPEDNWDLESNSSCLSSYSEEEEGDELVDKEMNKYMQTMDQELLTTDVHRTSVDNPTRKESVMSEGCESFSDVENFQPVKIDSAALESLLASYTMQRGGPGPASILLNQLNLSRSQVSASKKQTD
ncbi:protein ecdysoneless-like [Daphnia pulicaria]|uniref:protein ecdysoneless-like n=1 Tax=Daphnia pulicaria TaxID=35523 RepID=UPI001EEB505A|nr:protein ecdysoneless-like [Daphnia pulicaria]